MASVCLAMPPSRAHMGSGVKEMGNMWDAAIIAGQNIFHGWFPLAQLENWVKKWVGGESSDSKEGEKAAEKVRAFPRMEEGGRCGENAEEIRGLGCLFGDQE